MSNVTLYLTIFLQEEKMGAVTEIATVTKGRSGERGAQLTVAPV